MQHADDEDFALVRQIIDCVFVLQEDAQALRELLTWRSRAGKCQQSIASTANPGKQAIGRRLRSLGSNIGPDFGKVGFGRVG